MKSTAAVARIADGLRAAELETTAEDKISCRYAVQSKVRTPDSNGNNSEMYVESLELGIVVMIIPKQGSRTGCGER